MNLRTEFLNSLVTKPKASAKMAPESFLGFVKEQLDEPTETPFRILSGGKISASFPWSFDSQGIDSYLLLYTREGCGKLLVNNQIYTLNSSSLLFLDCSGRFRFDIAIETWKYDVVFFQGKQAAAFCRMLENCSPAVIQAADCSETALYMDYLSVQEDVNSVCSSLICSDYLNRVLTGILTKALSPPEASLQIPRYLVNIKKEFDTAYHEIYSLDLLAAKFRISKYRLCREFKAAYGYSPLQYLNRHRIEAARHLLLTTDLCVHEIGSNVGIDNTNHFINLFKRFEGNTPLEYRQRMSGR